MAPLPEMTSSEEAEVQALLSALTELSSRAGHDLLGPLNQAAALLALFIKRYRNQLDSDADHLMDFLESTSRRTEGVLAGVARFMEIAAARPNITHVDLDASLASSLALLEKPIAQSGAVIESEPLPSVSADPAQMVSLFELLIGNSIKFRKPDTPPHIQVSATRKGEIRGIAITDNGIGIDPEFCEAIFLPFRRLNGAEYPGSGLGLSMARLIAELNGGSIRVDPERDKAGTCIHFTLRAGL